VILRIPSLPVSFVAEVASVPQFAHPCYAWLYELLILFSTLEYRIFVTEDLWSVKQARFKNSKCFCVHKHLATSTCMDAKRLVLRDLCKARFM